MTIHKSKGLEFKAFILALTRNSVFKMDDVTSVNFVTSKWSAGIKYLADMREELDTMFFPTVKVSMDTLALYQLINVNWD